MRAGLSESVQESRQRLPAYLRLASAHHAVAPAQEGFEVLAHDV